MFNITQGTRVHFEARHDEMVLTPLTPRFLATLPYVLLCGAGSACKACRAMQELR